jgi:hypothetical protein
MKEIGTVSTRHSSILPTNIEEILPCLIGVLEKVKVGAGGTSMRTISGVRVAMALEMLTPLVGFKANGTLVRRGC